MKTPGWRPGRVTLPPEVEVSLGLARGERVLAAAAPRDPAGWLVATTYRLVWVGEPGWARDWVEIDGASWSRAADRLSVTWVVGGRPDSWTLGHDERLLEAVRDRVQASVVLGDALALGDRRTGKVAIRRDLRTGDLLDQVVLGRASRLDDPQVAAEVARVRADLREQVGMPPP